MGAYAAVNQGHCHPKIVSTLLKQAQELALTSRAFHNDALGEFVKFATDYFGYDRMLPMNTVRPEIIILLLSQLFIHPLKH